MSLKDIHNFDYVILLCRNMRETRLFYRDVMGFPLERDSENWVSFRMGSTLLTLRPRGRTQAWGDGPAAPGSAAVQLAFRVPPPAVDACHADWLRKVSRSYGRRPTCRTGAIARCSSATRKTI